MPNLATHHPQVKKNLLLIRGILGAVLLSLVLTNLKEIHGPGLWIYLAVLVGTFIPFFRSTEDVWEHVRSQYVVFSLDLALILWALTLCNRLETELLLSLFLTLFISALSRSLRNSALVALATICLYLYRTYWIKPDFNIFDPFVFLSCSLLLVVALHSGFLAFRTVEEESALVDMAKRMNLLDLKVKENQQTAFEYAATLKKVLDSLPLGAFAVSRAGEILFLNQPAARMLEVNPKSLLNGPLSNPILGPLGARMAQAIEQKGDLKRVYLDVEMKGNKHRYRLDSKEGSSPDGNPWGTLFLLQEAALPSADPQDPPKK
jgi:PAS domain-containing protein